MKNIIYLILIATLFSGCMGNSFRTQRYTNFKHAPKHQPEVQQSLVREHVDAKPQQINVSENKGPVSCSASNHYNDGIVAQAKSNDKQAKGKNVFSKPVIKDLVKEQNKPLKIKHNKSLNKKELAAKGIIGAALKIVILAVVLAIVIGIIILVVLL
ncbi:MAG: hypothetical protein ACXVC7_14385 [Bacteroidia bacterium]